MVQQVTRYQVDFYKNDERVGDTIYTTNEKLTMEEAASRVHSFCLIEAATFDNLPYDGFVIYDPNPDEPNSKNLYMDI